MFNQKFLKRHSEGKNEQVNPDDFGNFIPGKNKHLRRQW